MPPYSPMLAPVELFFSMVKNIIRQQMWDKNVWFNDLKGILEIFLLSRTEENLGFITCGFNSYLMQNNQS